MKVLRARDNDKRLTCTGRGPVARARAPVCSAAGAAGVTMTEAAHSAATAAAHALAAEAAAACIITMIIIQTLSRS